MCDGRRQEPRQRINCLIESRGRNINNIRHGNKKYACVCLCLPDWQSKLGSNTHTKWRPSFFGNSIVKVTTSWAAIIISAFIPRPNYSSPLPHSAYTLALLLSPSVYFWPACWQLSLRIKVAAQFKEHMPNSKTMKYLIYGKFAQI